MPTIIGDLGGLPLYSWVFSVYLLTSTVMMPIYGRLADIYGRRRILLIAIAVFLVGRGGVRVRADDAAAHRGARGSRDSAPAGLVPIALTVSGDLYSLKERARVQGLFSGVWGFASLVGPAARRLDDDHVRLALDLHDQRAAGDHRVRPRRDADGRVARPRSPIPLDVAGGLTLAAGVDRAALRACCTRPGGRPAAAARALAPASLAAAASLAALRAPPDAGASTRSSRRSSSATAQTAAPYVGGVLLGTTIYGVDTFVPLFVQGARGGTAGAAGAVVTPLVLLWALSATVAARLIVRFGFRRDRARGARS